MTFVEGMLDLVPTARVAHIGLYREPETFVAVEYFFKAPSDLHERLVIIAAQKPRRSPARKRQPRPKHVARKLRFVRGAR